MLCICIFSNKLDLNQAIRVSHNIVIFHFLQFSHNFFIAQTFTKMSSVRSSKNYAKQVSIMELKIFIRLVVECRKSDTQFKFSKFSFPIFNLKFICSRQTSPVLDGCLRSALAYSLAAKNRPVQQFIFSQIHTEKDGTH